MVSNALRLNLFGMRDASRDKAIRPVELPAIELPRADITRLMRITGMMCPHCEASVKKALEAIDGVTSAVPSHVEGVCIVTLSRPVEDALLRAAVEEEDYEVNAIE